MTSAGLPPEVLFHRFFQNRPRLQKQGYRGKIDLVGAASRLPLPGSFLGALQDALNAALANENTGIADTLSTGPFISTTSIRMKRMRSRSVRTAIRSLEPQFLFS